MSRRIVTPSTIPLAEIPGPDDWFVWESDSSGPTTTAAWICFRSWLAPGSWMSELAALRGGTRAA
jgi:hypothetical protein